jgi:predicted nucleotidyltransferase
MGDPVTRQCLLPLLPPALDRMWDTIVDLGEELPTGAWMLVGGQMVMLHGLLVGRTMTRSTNDVDVLAGVQLHPAQENLAACYQAVRKLGFALTTAPAVEVAHRFEHADGAVIDILAPDHQTWPPVTKAPGETIRIDGGTQALQRAEVVQVAKGVRIAEISIPSVLGALVLKGAAFRTDKLNPERHLYDATFLASLIADPLSVKAQFKGSDYKRILYLDKELSDFSHSAWLALGDYRDDAQAVWTILRREPANPLAFAGQVT